jgi:hypothetical protein
MSTRRRRTRIPAEFKATLRIGDSVLPVTTENLSMKGLLAVADADLEGHVGERCVFGLVLADDVRLAIDAEIVRAEGGEAAVEFKGMDEESYSHLRNIVRLSSEDPDAIDREQTIPAFEDKNAPK